MTQQITIMAACTITSNDEPRVSFESAVLGAVDEVFSALGNPVKDAIYNRMEKAYGLKRDEFPDRIQKFSEALGEIFGPQSNLIEIKIIERLHATYQEFSYTSAEKDLTFAEFIRYLELYLKC